MAYLGAIGTYDRTAELAWSRYVIAAALLAEVIASYATNGGYVYVS